LLCCFLIYFVCPYQIMERSVSNILFRLVEPTCQARIIQTKCCVNMCRSYYKVTIPQRYFKDTNYIRLYAVQAKVLLTIGTFLQRRWLRHIIVKEILKEIFRESCRYKMCVFRVIFSKSYNEKLGCKVWKLEFCDVA
jgi:hypothetical protein